MRTQLPLKKGYTTTTTTQFSARVCCGQTVGWIEMPLDREVDVGPGDIVLAYTGIQLLLKGHIPNFRPMSVVAKRLDG